MISGRRIGSILAVAGILLFLLTGWGAAQEKFPNRSIQFIIPWAAGGGGTINAQALQPHFEKAIQGSAQIINKPGGGGTIAWNYLANAAPDGYTTGIVNQSFLLTQYTTRTGVSYKKVDPLLMVVDMSGALAVRTEAPGRPSRSSSATPRPTRERFRWGTPAWGPISTSPPWESRWSPG
jgi:tripartite-type tricarboxylate transporter receptor subunit TctC